MWSRHITKSRFSYNRWIEGKQYRKEHRLENNILNQKIIKKKNSLLENLKISVTLNQKRLKLFGAFVVIFSLGFIYDYYLQHRHYVKKIEKTLKELILGTERVYSKSISWVDKMFVYPKNELQEQIGKYYISIDKKHPKGIQFVSSKLFSSLGVQSPESLDIVSFFSSIRKSKIPLQQIRDNIRLFCMSNQAVSIM